MIKSKTAKVITALTTLAAVFAVVAGLVAWDDRYAKAADVNQTQNQVVKSFKLINVNLELINLKNTKQSLKSEKRTITLKLNDSSNDVELRLMLDDINQDLTSISQKINTLESALITK